MKKEIIALIVLVLLAATILNAASVMKARNQTANSQDKVNLILVNAFPTNSVILSGLTQYLKGYFNVYFINLPGFIPDNPPLKDFSMDSNVQYLEQRIKDLNLDKYIIGGISFGFDVVNKAHLDPTHAQAIIALEPYINNQYLQLSPAKNAIYAGLANEMVEHPSVMSGFWENSYSDKILSFITGESQGMARQVLSMMDPKTFFATADYILNNTEKPVFHQNIPYVLIINRNDKTINATPIINLFETSLPNSELLVVYTTIEHFPRTITKEYFETHFSSTQVKGIINWIKEKSDKNYSTTTIELLNLPLERATSTSF